MAMHVAHWSLSSRFGAQAMPVLRQAAQVAWQTYFPLRLEGGAATAFFTGSR